MSLLMTIAAMILLPVAFIVVVFAGLALFAFVLVWFIELAEHNERVGNQRSAGFQTAHKKEFA